MLELQVWPDLAALVVLVRARICPSVSFGKHCREYIIGGLPDDDHQVLPKLCLVLSYVVAAGWQFVFA